MKLIREIKDLNKAIKHNKGIGFVPTMGGLHLGHQSLIKISKKKCKKTLVTIFVNPKQFNNIKDYKNYPKNLNKDLFILKKLKVDFVYIPTFNQIYKNKKLMKYKLKNKQKILCAKHRKGHFEGVLDIMNRFIFFISPKYVFMGEKDFQQLFLVKQFLEVKTKTKIISCKTIRDKNKVALSSRNFLLKKKDLVFAGLMAKQLMFLKSKISRNRKKSTFLIKNIKRKLEGRYNINIEYLETRNCVNLGRNIYNKKFKLFIAYYINNVRLIDNF